MSSFRIGTYNILIPRVDKDEKDHPWEKRKDDVVATIEENFDLVGIQEAISDSPHQQGMYLQTKLASLGWDSYLPEQDSAAIDLASFAHRIPIFWRKDSFRLLQAHTFLISSATRKEEQECPILEERFAVAGLFEEKTTGKEFILFNAHLQHGLDGSIVQQKYAQMKQFEADETISKVFHNLVNSEKLSAAIILGDFNNSVPVVPELTQLGFNNLANTLPAHKRHNWNYDSFHNWTVPEIKEGKHIDHVLVKGDDLKAISASIILSLASDHYPVQLVAEF